MHRVIEVSGSATAPVVRTKGDSNTRPDPWKATLSGEPVLERVAHVIPVVGQLIQLGRHVESARVVMLLLAAMGLLLAISPSFTLKDPSEVADTV